MKNQPIIYLMGVSGSGKSTIGKMLSAKTGIPFFDGDDLHPEANVKKMASGQSLNDDDRAGWLEKIHILAARQINTNGAIIVCSALKKKYRDLLADGLPNIYWVHLHGEQRIILERMKKRKGHFMPPALLQSQFDTLELPENALQVNIEDSPKEIVFKIMDTLNLSNNQSEFALLGLGVMGKSLARNLARNGFRLSLFNRHVDGVEEKVAERFVNEFPELKDAQGFDDLEKFVASIEQPRRIFLMVNAGPAVDAVINNLLPHLAEGDVIIEGGNSHYRDTERRSSELKKQGIHLIGCGVSGGEKGALEGPSIMPGGESDAYSQVSSYLEKIAAKDAHGKACCGHIGKGGAGHFVKMVHNGIEYAEMQLLAEVYQVLKNVNGWSNEKIANLLSLWNEGDLNSYLLEITIDILRKKEGDNYLLDFVLDKAGNKGTGSWTTVAAAELGVPTTMITAALFARYLSAFKSERVKANEHFSFGKLSTIKHTYAQDLESTYRLARIINHHQGIHLISAASEQYEWSLNLSELARIWTNGCIIRSKLMVDLISVLSETNRILTHSFFTEKIKEVRPIMAKTVGQIIMDGENVPCLTAASNFLNGYSSSQSSANMIQAQRDCFGAHTYRRVDEPEDQSFHSQWQNK